MIILVKLTFLLSRGSTPRPPSPPPTGVWRGWGSSGSFQPQAMALVMAVKQWGLGLKSPVSSLQFLKEGTLVVKWDQLICQNSERPASNFNICTASYCNISPAYLADGKILLRHAILRLQTLFVELCEAYTGCISTSAVMLSMTL
jgi:hypothetical protein